MVSKRGTAPYVRIQVEFHYPSDVGGNSKKGHLFVSNEGGEVKTSVDVKDEALEDLMGMRDTLIQVLSKKAE